MPCVATPRRVRTWRRNGRSVAHPVKVSFPAVRLDFTRHVAPLPRLDRTWSRGPGLGGGLADLLFSLSKLGAGWVGQHTERKRPLASLGYLATAFGTAAMGLTTTLLGLLSARGVAWIGRGFRSPLRDFMLADEVGAAHFGRAYGIERAADMLGAVARPVLVVAIALSGVVRRLFTSSCYWLGRHK